jgi:hypothetical protein
MSELATEQLESPTSSIPLRSREMERDRLDSTIVLPGRSRRPPVNPIQELPFGTRVQVHWNDQWHYAFTVNPDSNTTMTRPTSTEIQIRWEDQGRRQDRGIKYYNTNLNLVRCLPSRRQTRPGRRERAAIRNQQNNAVLGEIPLQLDTVARQNRAAAILRRTNAVLGENQQNQTPDMNQGLLLGQRENTFFEDLSDIDFQRLFPHSFMIDNEELLTEGSAIEAYWQEDRHATIDFTNPLNWYPATITNTPNVPNLVDPQANEVQITWEDGSGTQNWSKRLLRSPVRDEFATISTPSIGFISPAPNVLTTTDHDLPGACTLANLMPVRLNPSNDLRDTTERPTTNNYMTEIQILRNEVLNLRNEAQAERERANQVDNSLHPKIMEIISRAIGFAVERTRIETLRQVNQQQYYPVMRIPQITPIPNWVYDHARPINTYNDTRVAAQASFAGSATTSTNGNNTNLYQRR